MARELIPAWVDQARLPGPAKVRERLAARLTELRGIPDVARLSAALGTPDAVDDLSVRELGIAIRRIEAALEPEPAPLEITTLVLPDDAERHPGFAHIEDEIEAEDEDLQRRILIARDVVASR